MNDIRPGVNSEYARLVQRALRETVSPSLVVDGVVGNATMGAVREFASLMGIDPSGGYSSEVREHIDNYINQRFSKEQTYAAAAKVLEVPYHHLRAVCEVESRGSAFLPDGRCVILFERHQFRKRLIEAIKNTNVYEAVKRDTAFTGEGQAQLIDFISNKYPNICNAKSGGYLGGVSEHNRLRKAVSIQMETAYASASYGSFQIMGFNHKVCGYNSPLDMMLDFSKSEDKQIIGLVKFIMANKTMHQALRVGQWDVFAREYNGPAYAINNYDVKLAQSANRWKKLV